ncbi:MAG TPA: Asp-tRNA(Asn)/Glu-tRNA(Gln) amidotransferase subunit GatC [Candidatus Angelobacter sp.]|nr:Asp-tRNA(Asn)/Glu-tRNA(Gln) amidotransferase subunit GatC [Candidatus Angelobacter sp.]
MKVTEQDVTYVADLANLELTEQEHARMARDLNSILEYIDRLNEVDTSSVTPMAQVASQQSGALRQDELKPSLANEAALANAPDKGEGFFRVPKVIEK